MTRQSRRHLLYLASTFLLPVVFSAGVGPNAQCFFPNGRYAEEYVPCNLTNTVSPCCRKTEYCLGTGFCWGGPIGVIYRGGCTDQGWTSGDCPQHCLEEGHSDQWINVISCGTGIMGCVPSGNWGLTAGQNDCGNLKEKFGWNRTDIIPLVAGASNLATRSTVTATITPTGGAAQAICSDSPSSRQPDTALAARNRTIGVGLGIGIPLTILSVVFATAFMFERRKRKFVERNNAKPTAVYGYSQGADGTYYSNSKNGGEMEGDRPRQTIHEADGGYVGTEI